jgi:hypothetical protein
MGGRLILCGWYALGCKWSGHSISGSGGESYTSLCGPTNSSKESQIHNNSKKYLSGGVLYRFWFILGGK